MRRPRQPSPDAVTRFLLEGHRHLDGHGALVFMPVRNEEHTVAEVVADIRRSCDMDLLAVDDGSTDRTPAILKQLDVAVLTRRPGTGSRIVDGLRIGLELGYDHVVKIDGDGQHDAADIPRLHRHAVNTGAEIVIGSRHLHGFSGSRTGVRGSGMWFCSWLISFLYRKRVTDTTSGYKVWNRRACEAALRAFERGKLRQGSTYHVEELMIALKNRLAVEEVSVVIRPRRFGESKSFARKGMVTFPAALIWSIVRAML